MTEQPDQAGALFRLARQLEELEFPYMLTGGYALFFYSEPRFTNDIDIVIDLLEPQVDSLLACFPSEEGWYSSRVAAIEAVTSGRMFNVIHTLTGIKIDFAVLKPNEFEREKFRRRKRLEQGSDAIWIISPEDLLLSKLAWGAPSESAKQAADVRALIRDVSDLDWNYVNDRAKRSGLDGWLRRLRAI
ncbi:MAG: nucleotidyltransferase family protein [Planctomycetes bacterium]|nr:nucleotidyltransferase family protein [Planctomycetota bacterium]